MHKMPPLCADERRHARRLQQCLQCLFLSALACAPRPAAAGSAAGTDTVCADWHQVALLGNLTCSLQGAGYKPLLLRRELDLAVEVGGASSGGNGSDAGPAVPSCVVKSCVQCGEEEGEQDFHQWLLSDDQPSDEVMRCHSRRWFFRVTSNCSTKEDVSVVPHYRYLHRVVVHAGADRVRVDNGGAGQDADSPPPAAEVGTDLPVRFTVDTEYSVALKLRPETAAGGCVADAVASWDGTGGDRVVSVTCGSAGVHSLCFDLLEGGDSSSFVGPGCFSVVIRDKETAMFSLTAPLFVMGALILTCTFLILVVLAKYHRLRQRDMLYSEAHSRSSGHALNVGGCGSPGFLEVPATAALSIDTGTSHTAVDLGYLMVQHSDDVLCSTVASTASAENSSNNDQLCSSLKSQSKAGSGRMKKSVSIKHHESPPGRRGGRGGGGGGGAAAPPQSLHASQRGNNNPLDSSIQLTVVTT
eukprot:Rhum_TRINITY_DN14472_c3_g1::Rhum_TRINITY_DN14472_c3_g1_i1::g.90222::m.90222